MPNLGALNPNRWLSGLSGVAKHNVVMHNWADPGNGEWSWLGNSGDPGCFHTSNLMWEMGSWWAGGREVWRVGRMEWEPGQKGDCQGWEGDSYQFQWQCHCQYPVSLPSLDLPPLGAQHVPLVLHQLRIDPSKLLGRTQCKGTGATSRIQDIALAISLPL